MCRTCREGWDHPVCCVSTKQGVRSASPEGAVEGGDGRCCAWACHKHHESASLSQGGGCMFGVRQLMRAGSYNLRESVRWRQDRWWLSVRAARWGADRAGGSSARLLRAAPPRIHTAPVHAHSCESDNVPVSSAAQRTLLVRLLLNGLNRLICSTGPKSEQEQQLLLHHHGWHPRKRRLSAAQEAPAGWLPAPVPQPAAAEQLVRLLGIAAATGLLQQQLCSSHSCWTRAAVSGSLSMRWGSC
jgi:hypothetical protein